MTAPAHLQRLLDRLESVHRSGNQWRARCPAHEDTSPSLSIGIGDKQQVLLNCFGGCPLDSILRALNVERRDLRPEGGSREPRSARGAATRTIRVFETLEEARSSVCPRGSTATGTWAYRDAEQREVMWVCRFDPIAFPAAGKKPKKTFRPIHRYGDGFAIGDPPPPLPLYRLPELVAAPTAIVFISEGEKKSDELAKLGLIATTTAHGAQSPNKTDLSPLSGRDVVIVPDNDRPGDSYASKVAELLSSLSPSPTIRVLRLPDLPLHGDAVEFVADRRAKGLSDPAISSEIEILVSLASKHEPSSPPSTEVGDPGCRRNLTDTGNAERLVDGFSNELRFCHPWNKFLEWDNRRWRIDGAGRAMRRAKDVVRSIYDEAAKIQDDELRKAVFRWAKTSESAGHRRALLELARSEDGIPIEPAALDADPWLLNCNNGALDLRTGELRAHRREDLLTKLAPVAFDRAAIAPRWQAFLDEVIPDAQTRRFVQRAVGWSLTADNSQQVLFFCYGLGANGKSVFLRTLLELLGIDYAIQAAPELLFAKQQRSHPTEVADLFGVRLAVCVEVGAGRAINEVLIKQLTGGDRIRARRMREDFWEFEPTHHLWLAANHKPVIAGSDEAIWRRFHVIPFTVTIPIGQRDPKLLQKLKAELPGILNWAVEGCLAWQRDGLQPPLQVSEANADYRAEMDVIGGFLDERCVFASSAKTSARDLYSAYSSWSRMSGEEPLTQREFGLRLTERGIAKRKSGVVVYVGVGIKHDADTDDPGSLRDLADQDPS